MTFIYTLVILMWLKVDAAGFFARIQAFDWYASIHHEWATVVPILAGQRVLEAGCGPGELSRHIARMGAQIDGIDKSETMLARARRGAPDGCHFSTGDALTLSSPDARYDVVIAASLVNLVPSPSELIDELARVTRPGGAVSVLFPTPALSERASDIVEARSLRGLSAQALLLWARRGPKQEVEKIEGVFRESGLVEVRIERFLDNTVAAVIGQIAEPG